MIDIKPAQTKDIPELCRLLNVLFSQEAEFQPNGEAQAKGLQQIIEHPEIGTILVAKQGEHILGMVNLLYTLSTALGETVVLLEDLVVLPDARNLGIGTQLLRFATEFLKTRGIKRITLLTDVDNENAHRFYQTQGFERSSMVVFRQTL